MSRYQAEYDYSPFESVQLRAINVSSRSILSKSLNVEQVIPSKDGLQRDFRGLAQLMDFTYQDLVSVQRSSDPTKALLDSYQRTVKGDKSTVRDLMAWLEAIGRYDVIDDVWQSLEKDVQTYNNRKVAGLESLAKDLTIDDSKDAKSIYDAYVCYADADLDFVVFLAKFLESPQIGLRLYIRERDPLIGNMDAEGFVEVLQSRCKRMLIILSPDFLSSNECVFQSNVAQALATNEQKCRMLIPVIYERCEVPTSINMLTKVDLSRGNNSRLDWIWKRLVSSLADPQRVKSMNFQHLTAEYLAFLENNPKSKPCSLRNIPVHPSVIPEESNTNPSSDESLLDRLPSIPTESLPPSYSDLYLPEVPSGPLTNVSTVSSCASLVASKSKKTNWLTSLKNKVTKGNNDAQVSSELKDGHSSQSWSMLQKR